MHVLLILAAVLVTHSAAFPGESAMPLPIRMITYQRSPRSLINTFPFNQRQPGHDHNHAHEHHHHEELPVSDSFQIRQGIAATSNDLSIGNVANSGEKCVEKVMMIEETVYDDGIECHHSYDKRCHTTYTTDYEPQQVEECDENFVKECFIEYKPVAHNETIEICNEKPVRDCDTPGPIVCKPDYESVCETTYVVHEVVDDKPNCTIKMEEKCHEVTQGYTTKEQCDKWPVQTCVLSKETNRKYTPDTKCVKHLKEVCGPGPCPIVKGPKECRTDIKTVVQDVPEETCNLKAQPFCRHVTKLVPILKPSENCVDVPREVCARVRTNPRKEKKPVIKKWCYVPSKESGLPTTKRPPPPQSTTTEASPPSTTTTTTAAPETQTDKVPAPLTTTPAPQEVTEEVATTAPPPPSGITEPSGLYSPPAAPGDDNYVGPVPAPDSLVVSFKK